MKTILTTISLLLTLLVFTPNAAADCLGISTDNTPLPCHSSPYDTDGDGIPDWTIISYNDGTVCVGAGFNDLPYGMQPLAPFAGAAAGPCDGPLVGGSAGCHPFLEPPCSPHASGGAGGGAVPTVAAGGSAGPNYGAFAGVYADDNQVTLRYNAFQDETIICTQGAFEECVTIQMPA